MGFNCGIVGLPNVGKSTLFNALTQTAAAQAANYPFCTIEPNVGDVGVPDERLDKLADHRQVGRDHPDAAQLRRHRRPGARRLQGRRPRQPVPRQHPRGRRGRLRAALLRGRRRHPRRGPRRSARDAETVETELMLADLDSLERRRDPLAKKAQGRRQGSQGPGSALMDKALRAAARRQAGAHRQARTPRRSQASARCSS